FKEICTRTGFPFSRPSGRCPCGHVPGRHEAAEMVQTNHADMSQQGTQAVDAPAIAQMSQGIPVVHGIPPQLSLRTEVVRRHAGHEERPMPLIKKEEFRMRPYVTGIGRYEKRQVSDQT